MSKKGKNIVILLSVLLIIVLILSSMILSIEKKYSRDNVKDRLIFGIDNLNYSYSEKNATVSVCGKFAKSTSSNKETTVYYDYKDEKCYTLKGDLSYTKEEKNKGIVDMQYYKSYIEKYFDNAKYNYDYKGQTENYTVVEFWSDEENDGIMLWIDNSSNLVKKEQKTYKVNDKKTGIGVSMQNYDSGKYTEKDVKYYKK